jgi:hypothetical protein
MWANPKRRPWILGGAGVAAGAAYLSARRPVDPDEAAAEDSAVAQSLASEPTAIEGPMTYGDAGVVGALPIVVGGSGYTTPDPAFMEMDLSGVYAEIDALAAGQQEVISEAVTAQTAGLRARAKKQGAKVQQHQEQLAKARKVNAQQKKTIKRTRARVHRLENQVQRAAKRPPRKPAK